MSKINKGILLSMPALAPMILVFLIPSLRLVRISLQSAWPGESDWTFMNYMKFISDSYYRQLLFESFKLAIVVTAMTLAVGYPVAYYMTQASPRVKGAILVVLVSPLLVSVVVRAFGWMVVLGHAGVINSVLLSLRLIDSPLYMTNSYGAVLVGFVHVLLPFMILPIASVLQTVDRSLIEISRSLGAGTLYTFFKVTLPLTSQGISAGCLLVFALTMGAYATPYILGGGKTNNLATTIYSMTIYMVPDYPFGAAMAGILVVATMVFLVLFLRYSELKMWSEAER